MSEVLDIEKKESNKDNNSNNKENNNLLNEIDEKNNNKKININKKPKKKFIKLLFIFIILTFIIFAILLSSIKNNYVRSFIMKVPIVKNILTSKEKDDVSCKDNLKKLTRSDLLYKIDSLEKEIKEYEKEIKNINDLNSIYASEILRLKEIEKLQLEFKHDKEKFDKMIAKENKLNFIDFYKSISPENAENIYREILTSNKFNKEFKNFIDTFEYMDKNKAAKALENMMSSDISLVSTILNNISVEKRSSIIGAMNSSNASIVIRAISPEENKRK